MSKDSVELPLFGQVLRLHCPEEQQEGLFDSARRLEQRVATLKEQSGIIQLEKVLSIVALNLHYELEQEQRKVHDNQQVLTSCLQLLERGLVSLQNNSANAQLIEQENNE